MKSHLHLTLPITLAFLSACSGNSLNVGKVDDAGVSDGAGGPGQCEYQGRLYKDGEARADACSMFCDGKSGQFVATPLLCMNDGGDQEGRNADAATQCEYRGGLVSPGVSFPADDGCNTCECNPVMGKVLCTLMKCPPCPFLAVTNPTSLGTILGAGKSPTTNTIYVVDQVDNLQRTFVSDASGVLKRQRVAGSGSGPGFMVFTTNGPDAIVTVQIEYSEKIRMMGVVQGTLKDKKTFTIGQEGESLLMLADVDVASLPVRNLPGSVTTEYVASTPDGKYLLVTRPNDDWSYTDFRVFFGPANAMDEGRVTNVSRAKDGGSTTIDFRLLINNGFYDVTASFPLAFADGGFVPGAATLSMYLTSGDPQVTPLTRLSAPPANASYRCGIRCELC